MSRTKRRRRRLNPVFVIFLVAFAAFLVTLAVLWFGVGYRYVKDATTDTRFLGYVDSNGRPESGKLYFNDGTKAELDAENDTITYENGDTYVGEHDGFVPNGEGTLTVLDTGDVYSGTFISGKMNGYGVITYGQGDRYEGNLRDGLYYGEGKYTRADGSTYEGNFLDNMKHGKGIYRWASGSVFIGTYDNELKSGYGAYLYADGDIYVGHFSADARDGKGLYIWGESREYNSEFAELFGVSYSDGFMQEFYSYFETDFPRLFDKSTWGNTMLSQSEFWIKFEQIWNRQFTEKYAGEYKENARTGEGHYWWSSGHEYQGTFENGVLIKSETLE